jgi:hypothetical protein
VQHIAQLSTATPLQTVVKLTAMELPAVVMELQASIMELPVAAMELQAAIMEL